MSFLRIADLTVDHASPSNASRPPVLFIHGYFASAVVWTEWLPFFAARGFPAYAINLRGRGGSRPGINVGRASINDFVDDATAVVNELGAPVVVGHSMGGLITQRLAELGATRAAVLITPAPPRGINVLTPRVALRQLKYLPAILRSRVMTPQRDDLREIVLNRVPVEMQDAILDELIPDSGRAGRDMSIAGVPIDASRVHCPMLVIAAEHDLFVPKRVVERIAKRYNAPIQTMPGHGHMVINEPGWETLADLVARWIAGL